MSTSHAAWTDRVRTVYDHSAGSYDIALALFPLGGFRAGAYRRRTIAALGVHLGDTVVDLGCGTGHTLPLLARAAGAHGRVAVLDFKVPRSCPALAQTPVFALAARLGETWEMARRDIRDPLSRHVALDTDESFFFGAAYVAAGHPAR